MAGVEVSMVYKWKSGARAKVDAQEIGEELERVRQRDAPGVMRAARRSKGALHAFVFDRTREKAAEAYYIERAEYLLRTLVEVHEVDDGKGGEAVTVEIRAYEAVRIEHDDKPEGRMTYVPTREALSDPELRAQVMNRLDSTIAEAQRTAKNYSYLVPALKRTDRKLEEARATLRV